jgi:hypothetical protein
MLLKSSGPDPGSLSTEFSCHLLTKLENSFLFFSLAIGNNAPVQFVEVVRRWTVGLSIPFRLRVQSPVGVNEAG